MGCTHSSPKDTKKPLPSRPLPTKGFYYKYHALPQSAPRYQSAYDSLTAGSKKKHKAPNIETCSMTSVKIYRMRERPLSAKLRVVNNDASFEDGGVDRLAGEEEEEEEEEQSLEDVRVLYEAWMRVDWMAEGY